MPLLHFVVGGIKNWKYAWNLQQRLLFNVVLNIPLEWIKKKQKKEKKNEPEYEKKNSYSKGNPFVKVKQNISLFENERKNHTNSSFFIHFRGAFSAIDKTKYAYLCFVINSFSNSPISIFFAIHFLVSFLSLCAYVSVCVCVNVVLVSLFSMLLARRFFNCA